MLSALCAVVLSQVPVSGFLAVGEAGDGSVVLRAGPSTRSDVVARLDMGPQGLQLVVGGSTQRLPTPDGWIPATSLAIVGRQGVWRKVRVPSSPLEAWVRLTELPNAFEVPLAGAWVGVRGRPAQEWHVERVTPKGLFVRPGDACAEPPAKRAHSAFISWQDAFDARGVFLVERLDIDCC